MNGNDSLIGATIGRRFLVLRKIGRGGMGTVYLAKQLNIGRPVAIKVLDARCATGDEFGKRFRREAKQMAKVAHPNVVVIHDVGRTPDGILYIVMEYVAGSTLKSLIQHAGALPIERAVRLAIQLAEALEAVHRVGIIHRDVKPDNVVVQHDDRIKLMDFGIARRIDCPPHVRLTRADQILGTPRYMAPEQIEDGAVSSRTDIYSWAIVFYEMLVGSAPFSAGSAAALFHQHLHHKPAPLRELRADVPPTVEEIVMRCLEKDPARRCGNLGDVVRQLRSFAGTIAGPPVSTRAGRAAGSKRIWPLPAALFSFVAAVTALLYWGF